MLRPLPTPALYSVAPEVLRKYRDRFPKVELILTGAGTEEQVEALDTHQLDVGFLSPPIRQDSIQLQVLYEGGYLVALPTSHPVANQAQVSLASLAKEPIIFYPRSKGPTLHAEFLKRCEQAGFSPNIVQEVEMTHTRLGLVAAGIGIAFVASCLRSLTTEGVIYRPLKEDLSSLQIALAWRRQEQSPIVHEFIHKTLSHAHWLYQ